MFARHRLWLFGAAWRRYSWRGMGPHSGPHSCRTLLHGPNWAGGHSQVLWVVRYHSSSLHVRPVPHAFAASWPSHCSHTGPPRRQVINRPGRSPNSLPCSSFQPRPRHTALTPMALPSLTPYQSEYDWAFSNASGTADAITSTMTSSMSLSQSVLKWSISLGSGMLQGRQRGCHQRQRLNHSVCVMSLFGCGSVTDPERHLLCTSLGCTVDKCPGSAVRAVHRNATYFCVVAHSTPPFVSVVEFYG